MTNRLIKLRAWDKQKQLFTPVLTLADLENPGLVVQEFTGVYDANGREIWEGDILYWSFYDEASGERDEAYHEVVFQHGCFGTIGSWVNSEFDPFDVLSEGDVVVGNVFEHGYLLKTQPLPV